MTEDLVHRLKKRAEIRRQITYRKSVREGKPDRIADLLEEAAQALEANKHEPVAWMYKDKYGNLNQSSSPTVPPDSFPVYTASLTLVVPDVLTTTEGEHPEYVQGWNDCRQLMLQTRKNT